MRRAVQLTLLTVAAAAALAAEQPQVETATIPEGSVTLHVVFRPKGQGRNRTPLRWDGRVAVEGGEVRSLAFWRADPRDTIEGNAWKMTNRRRIPRSQGERARGYERMPVLDAILVVELAGTGPATTLSFKTAQGDFSFALREIPAGGRKGFLDGLVQVSCAATSALILSAPTEDDFASAALAPDGKLYVAYVAFTHGPHFRKRMPITEPPKDFSVLAEPTGGDQVMLLRLEGRKWTGPMPVTPKGQDVYRTALAVDGSGTVWVFWAGNQDGNWDIYARALAGERRGKTLRLSTDPGPDCFPAATTDSEGRVWVAWQAFRGNDSRILAARQSGAGFGQAITVADTPANEWAPAIAASSDGQVAVAWDTYAKGDYDVYCRIWSGGQFGDQIPIATSPRGEMRASIAFDKAGRLWIAYEDSPELWGKDWGALEKQGVPLFQNRSVDVRVWAQGRLWKTKDSPVVAFSPWLRGRSGGRGGVRLAAPRLAADATGRVWLAVRSPRYGERTGVGTAFFEHLAFYEGSKWSSEIVCGLTDNILDNRPAMVAAPDGRLLLVTSSDRRYATAGRLPWWLIRELRQKGERIEQKAPKPKWPDPVNNELVMAEVGPVGSPRPPELQPVPTPSPGKPSEWTVRERADLARIRSVRVNLGGKTFRLFRGEFHRHTEISGDGGGDGMLMDMWRYALDAASLDWIGNGDHDNGGGREYSWWITQKTTDLFVVPGYFTPMFSYERSCRYPDGHRNVVFAHRGIRTLPRLRGGQGKAMDNLPPEARRPNSPDTQMLYRYLAQFDGICASHTSGTDMGTDWRDNNPKVEPVVEIYQGCRQNYEMPGAPRTITAQKALGGWRPYGFVSLALKKGYRLGFQASSDHISTHISYCNVWVEAPTREAILEGMKRRRVYGATDNTIAIFRCGDHFMGDEFTTSEKPSFAIHLLGTRPFAKVHIIKDGNYVHTVEPNKADVELTWVDMAATPGKTSYYYVRGELVWASPMWITYKP